MPRGRPSTTSSGRCAPSTWTRSAPRLRARSRLRRQPPSSHESNPASRSGILPPLGVATPGRGCMRSFRGSTALITGASSGIGEELARLLARQGMPAGSHRPSRGPARDPGRGAREGWSRGRVRPGCRPRGGRCGLAPGGGARPPGSEHRRPGEQCGVREVRAVPRHRSGHGAGDGPAQRRGADGPDASLLGRGMARPRRGAAC